MVALAAAAFATTDLRVAPLVLCNDFKHPAVHAKEIATLDVLSGGRAEWGMGAGWLPTDYQASGITFDAAGQRVRRLQEAVSVMTSLFADGPTNHEGEHYVITNLDGLPKPVQTPHPPLLIGASRKKLLSFAAREADIVGIGPSFTAMRVGNRPPIESVRDATDRQLGWIRDAAGGRYSDLELNMVAFPVIVTDEREVRAERAAARLGLDPKEVLASPHAWIGTVEEICDELEARRDRWDISYWVVPAATAGAVAPIVERLAGR
jgi:probable F420-dependent oxidoreductase